MLELAVCHARWAGISPAGQIRRRWKAGLARGVLIGALLASRVLAGPGPPATPDPALAGHLAWLGLVYGAADALLASLLVTAMYHLGFPEFRGRALVQPLIGNGLVTAGYLLTGNPLTPAVAHVLLHGAAVVRGPEVTVQLPPHRRGAGEAR